MTLIAVKLIVFKNGKVFLNFAPFAHLFDLLTTSIGDRSHIFSNEVYIKNVLFWFLSDAS